MKLLHIAECAGGVERYLQMLTPRLKARNIKQTLVCSETFTPSKFDGCVDEIYISGMKQTFSPVTVIKIIKELRKKIKETNPDIIYCHSSFGGVYGRIAALGLGCKVIYNPHGWAFNMAGAKSLLFKWIERVLARNTDIIVCISEAERKSAITNKIAGEDKLVKIENGIDLEEIRKAKVIRKVDMGIPEDAFVVGMVGRISKQKAPDIFLKAAKHIIQQIPNTHFVIVGDGAEREDIEKLAQQQPQINLHITGWVDNSFEYMMMLDVGMLLSRWEGFGYAIVEYMAAGKPVVATNVDALPTIISDGEDGILVNVDSPEEAANAVVNIYNNNSLREKLISNALNKVGTKYSIDRVVEQHISLFEKLTCQAAIRRV